MIRAHTKDKGLVVELLSASFSDNRSVNDVVKKDEKREERIRALMSYAFDVCHAFGEIWISDNKSACALLLFPDKKRTSAQTILWDLKLALSVIGISRVMHVLKREIMIKATHPKIPFAYLWFIGVMPKEQNKGVGTAFMQEVIRECKRKDRPVYLETSMEKSIPFYQKLGFEIFSSLQLTYTLYHLRKT